jgi:predicted Rossmann-fold nucleotide-binding protein
MGIIAGAVLRAGGEAQGVIPEHLIAREVGRKGLTKLRVVRSMHERKALMADLSDAFVALPGGLRIPQGFACKPSCVLGFYSPLLAALNHAVEERFLKTENRALVRARDQRRPAASTGAVASGAH